MERMLVEQANKINNLSWFYISLTQKFKKTIYKIFFWINLLAQIINLTLR